MCAVRTGPLAYVFAHERSPGADVTSYEERLRAFHAALAADPPPGFLGSWCWRTPQGRYEDWYLLADWGAVGALETAAVTGTRAGPHDTVAGLSGPGAGAVYGLVHGAPAVPARRWRLRAGKPRGEPDGAFERRVAEAAGGGAVLWRRRLVLGTDREFLLDTGHPGSPPSELAESLGLAGAAPVDLLLLERVVAPSGALRSA